MSTEQKYRELIPGEVIQPGDEWMDFQGNWHRGITNSMGENYRPEPDSSGRGNVYHCRHRRPLTDWEALYREEVIVKDGWKESRNKLLAELAKVTKNREDWKEVHTLAERAIQRLKSERDEFAKRLEDALSDKVIAEKSYNEAKAERDEAVKEVAHLKDVLADANKNYRLIEDENRSLNVQLSLARTALNGQERRHKEEIGRLRGEIAKLNADYLKVMVERDEFRRDLASIAMPREAWMPKPPENLREDIIRAINCRNAESGSDTPDWILGNFLMASLEAFDVAVKDRTQYYGEHGPIPTNPPIG